MARRPTRSRCLEALCLALACAASGATAATRLDDSASPRRHVELTTQWESRSFDAPADDEMLAVTAEARDVEVRLNTAAWVGRNVEIYIAFPQAIPGLRLPSALRIEWRTRGRFNAGVAMPGQRALVYRGPIADALSGDIFDFTYRIDGRYFDRRLQFEPTFEIEALP